MNVPLVLAAALALQRAQAVSGGSMKWIPVVHGESVRHRHIEEEPAEDVLNLLKYSHWGENSSMRAKPAQMKLDKVEAQKKAIREAEINKLKPKMKNLEQLEAVYTLRAQLAKGRKREAEEAKVQHLQAQRQQLVEELRELPAKRVEMFQARREKVQAENAARSRAEAEKIQARRERAAEQDARIYAIRERMLELESRKRQLKSRRLEAKQKLEELERSVARAACEKMAYIGPHRTAGVTLGKVIMPTMVAENNQTQYGSFHTEYNWAVATAPNCIIASLRDPVERFLSEYSVFRSLPVEVFEDTDWDVHTADLEWLREVHSKDFEQGLEEYLTAPGNPAINRQARYLLGFERVWCAGRKGDICSRGSPGYPAFAYDLHRSSDQYGALLRLAKQRLQSLRAFSVADCFPESMETVATAVGWEPSRTAAMARDLRYGAHKNATCLGQYCTSLGTDYIGLARQFKDRPQMPWAATLPPSLKRRIRALNQMDAELVDFAKQLLYERHGIKCGV